jgi:hypothetical protein
MQNYQSFDLTSKGAFSVRFLIGKAEAEAPIITAFLMTFIIAFLTHFFGLVPGYQGKFNVEDKYYYFHA